MTKISLKNIALIFLLAAGAASAQRVPLVQSYETTVPYTDESPLDAPNVIFSNLDPRPTNRYNGSASFFFKLAGISAIGEDEDWVAVAFTPKVDTRAQVLSVPVGYISGTNSVNIGIYTNDFLGTVGSLVPGSLVSLTPLPSVGGCCELATVTLPGDGALLTGGARYWLAVTSDDVNAPTFRGGWQVSNLATSAGLHPPFPWGTYAGEWPAALIRGTNVQSSGSEATDGEDALVGRSADRNTILYSTLPPGHSALYSNGGAAYVTGSAAVSQPENSVALPFVPTKNSHAKILAAAISYNSGMRKVTLGLHSDSDGNVGTLLPGGQGSTTHIPDEGTCCDLTKVNLPGAGVALTKGTQYWLVAAADNSSAPDFWGTWQTSNLSATAYSEPEDFIDWTSFDSVLLAAEIRGTNP